MLQWCSGRFDPYQFDIDVINAQLKRVSSCASTSKPCRGDAAAPLDAFYSNFVKRAYVEADIDTISTIRRLAAEADAPG